MNNVEIILSAIEKGAQVFSSISGGKDGQAMVNVLAKYGIPQSGLIHADLGKAEWPESFPMCNKLSERYSIPLSIALRTDGNGLVEHMQNRLNKLKGTGKPFWPSSAVRYCTGHLKQNPINKVINGQHDFLISAEGIRAQESTARGKKEPLIIRSETTSTYYDGMTVEEAIAAYKTGKRLVLTWYPIFNYTLDEVWATEGMTSDDLNTVREEYNLTGIVPTIWPFHPAYVYGNERVSCIFCVLGCMSDLKVGAKHHPELLKEYIQMEQEGAATFKNKFSLESLIPS